MRDTTKLCFLVIALSLALLFSAASNVYWIKAYYNHDPPTPRPRANAKTAAFSDPMSELRKGRIHVIESAPIPLPMALTLTLH